MKEFVRPAGFVVGMALCLTLFVGCGSGGGPPGSASGPVVEPPGSASFDDSGDTRRVMDLVDVDGADWYDLREAGYVVDDGESWEVEVTMGFSPPVVDSPLVDAYYAFPSGGDEAEFGGFLSGVLSEYENLEFRIDGDVRDFLGVDPAVVSFTTYDEGVLAGWFGRRYSGDGAFLGAAAQEASFYVSPEYGRARVNGTFTDTLPRGVTAEAVDVEYYADFLTAVLGREIEPSFVLSLLKYAETHMVRNEELGCDERAVCVTFGLVDVDPVYAECDVYTDDEGFVHYMLGASVYVEFDDSL